MHGEWLHHWCATYFVLPLDSRTYIQKINVEFARLGSTKDERRGVKDLGVGLSLFISFLQHGKWDKGPLLLTVITRGRSERKKKKTLKHNVAQAAPTTHLGN